MTTSQREHGHIPQPGGGEYHWTWPQVEGPEVFTRLYAKAVAGQWAADDMDWAGGAPLAQAAAVPDHMVPIFGTPLWDDLGPERQQHLREGMMVWNLSGLLHGERSGIVGPAATAFSVPWEDAKKVAAVMLCDEARHTDVLERYFAAKAPDTEVTPISGPLSTLLETALNEPRSALRHLVAGCVAEGLALAIYGGTRMVTDDPLLSAILKGIVDDEARHVAFAVALVENTKDEWSAAEQHEAEDMALAAVEQMAQGGNFEPFADVGLDPADVQRCVTERQEQGQGRSNFVFSHVTPNLKRLGMITARTRPRYAELGLVDA